MGMGGISVWQLIIIGIVLAVLLFSTKRAFWNWILISLFAASSTAIIIYFRYQEVEALASINSAVSAICLYILIKYFLFIRISIYSFFLVAVLGHLLRNVVETFLYMAEEGDFYTGWMFDLFTQPKYYLNLYASAYFVETVFLALIITYLLREDTYRKGVANMQTEDVKGMIFIPRTNENIYSKLEVAKLEVVKQVEEIASELSQVESLDVEFTHSLPYSGAIWVQLRLLVSESGVQRRLQLLVTLTGHEFHRFQVEYTLEFQENDKRKRLRGVYALDKEELTKIVRSMIDGNSLSRVKSGISLPRFRTSIQFWLDNNKIDRLSNPWLMPNIILAIGYITAFIGVGVIFILIGVGMMIVVPLKKKYIVTSGKPYSEPRSLKLVDSWQSVVFSLGERYEEIKQQVLTKLNESLMKGSDIREEKIWYWGLDGKVERQQLVITNNRGIAYIHIYSYGEDLYIGWDAHMNYGQWVEKDVATGKDKTSGKMVKLKSIETGWQSVNEYDVQDAISLGEWCHAQVVKVVKLAMKEYEIDQEINFQILREARAGLTQQADESKRKIPGLGALKRLG
jgi:hypothetical protein